MLPFCLFFMMSYIYFVSVNMYFDFIGIILNILVSRHLLMSQKLFINTICNGCLLFCCRILSLFVEPVVIIGLECPFQTFDIMGNISLSILVPHFHISQIISCGWVLPCGRERAVSMEGPVFMVWISVLWKPRSEWTSLCFHFLFCKMLWG